MLLGGAKVEHFSCSHSSCQLGFCCSLYKINNIYVWVSEIIDHYSSVRRCWCEYFWTFRMTRDSVNRFVMRKNVLRFACFQVVYQNFFIISARDDFFLEKKNYKWWLWITTLHKTMGKNALCTWLFSLEKAKKNPEWPIWITRHRTVMTNE